MDEKELKGEQEELEKNKLSHEIFKVWITISPFILLFYSFFYYSTLEKSTNSIFSYEIGDKVISRCLLLFLILTIINILLCLKLKLKKPKSYICFMVIINIVIMYFIKISYSFA